MSWPWFISVFLYIHIFSDILVVYILGRAFAETYGYCYRRASGVTPFILVFIVHVLVFVLVQLRCYYDLCVFHCWVNTFYCVLLTATQEF